MIVICIEGEHVPHDDDDDDDDDDEDGRLHYMCVCVQYTGLEFTGQTDYLQLISTFSRFPVFYYIADFSLHCCYKSSMGKLNVIQTCSPLDTEQLNSFFTQVLDLANN